MNKQERLQRVLDDLEDAVPDIEGSMLASLDGLSVASTLGEVESSRVAAMTATVLALAARVVQTTDMGRFEETVIRSDAGAFVVYDAGDLAALALVARPGANLGLIHLEARRAAEALSGLLRSFSEELAPPAARDEPAFEAATA